MKFYFVLLILTVAFSCASEIDYQNFDKIDAHVHLVTSDTSFIKVAKKNHFRLLTLVTNYDTTIARQFEMAKYLHKKFPETVSFLTSFRIDDINQPGWREKTVAWLKKCFDEGAIGVKVWKNIGMVNRNADGSFIMVDDARLDPIFDFIELENKTLTAHIGEPKNCWLPLEQMTTFGDSSYFAEHPQYHMYLHPEYPEYRELIDARDRMLAKHPNLRVVGAHLGSLEWSVDELAKRFDKYPNFSVDMAERIVHFKVQDRKKVRDFIINYQDRLLYGTDISIHDDRMQETSGDYLEKRVNNTWLEDWKYFTTDDILTQKDKVRKYRGLKLPSNVVKKIYYENAIRMYPELKK